MNKMAKYFLTILGILAVTAIVIISLIMTNRDNQKDRFSVTDFGIVYAKANIANITIGVKSEVKKTAIEASQENSQKMNAVIKAIKLLGVEDKDIKTNNYRLTPVYNWLERRGQNLKGYQASQDLSLKIRDLNKIGDIIAATTKQGANQIGNVSFTIDDEYDLKNQARKIAIEKAEKKAKSIAQQTGMKLGKVKGFYENQPKVSPYNSLQLEMPTTLSNNSLNSPNIEAGQNEIKVTVSIIYAVK